MKLKLKLWVGCTSFIGLIALTIGPLFSEPVDLSHMFPKKSLEEELFRETSLYETCDVIKNLSKSDKEKFAKYASTKISEKGSRELALGFIRMRCLGSYSELYRSELVKLLFSSERDFVESGIIGLSELECRASESIADRLLALYKDGFGPKEKLVGLIICSTPDVKKIEADASMDRDVKRNFLYWIERHNAERLLIPVYPFDGHWISPITSSIDSTYVKSEWIVLGTDSSVRTKISKRNSSFHGIGCDHLNEGDPVYELDVSTSIGIPILAFGPVKNSEFAGFHVEKGKVPSEEKLKEISDSISEHLLSEYGYKPKIKYYTYPGKDKEQYVSRSLVGQIVSFSSGAIVFQWEHNNSTGTFRKCIRVVGPSGSVSSCNEIDEFFNANLGEYLFYHISNADLTLDSYVAITANEPWTSEKGTTWGPERRIFKLDGDIKAWENFDSMLDPRCMSI